MECAPEQTVQYLGPPDKAVWGGVHVTQKDQTAAY